MARKLKQISLSKHKNIILCADEKSLETILQYLFNNDIINEYKKIQAVLFEGLHNKQLYQKLKNLNTVYEIRFTNNGRNDRIYCKQIKHSKKKYIILIKLYNKKSQAIPKNISKQLKQIDNYEYNF